MLPKAGMPLHPLLSPLPLLLPLHLLLLCSSLTRVNFLRNVSE